MPGNLPEERTLGLAKRIQILLELDHVRIYRTGFTSS